MGLLVLLSKILFSLLAAALAGFWLGYWWFKRNFEVVTDSEMRMVGQSNAVDLSPIQQRLKGVEDSVRAIRIRDEDLNPLTRRLDRIENRMGSPNDSLDVVNTKFSQISNKLSDIRSPNLRPLEERLDRVEYAVRNINVPETDLGSVHSSLALLEMAINDQETREPNLNRVFSQFNTLENKIDNLIRSLRESREMEMDTLKTQISRVNTNLTEMVPTRAAPQQNVDMTPVFDRLAGIERAVMSMDRTTDVDFSEINDRLELIELKLAEPLEFDVPSNEREFEVLFDRLQGMETTIAEKLEAQADWLPVLSRFDDLENALRLPSPEIDVVIGRIAALEDSLRMLEPKPIDLSGLYARFAGIEQGLDGIRREATNNTGTEMIERRLASLQATLLGIEIPEPDYTQLEQRIAELQQTLLSIEVPEVDYAPLISSLRKVETSVDISSIEDRLRAIELGLSSLQRDVKTRPAEAVTKTAEVRERLRPLVRSRETRTFEPTNYSEKRSNSYRDGESRSSGGGYRSRNEDPLSDARRPGDRANLLVRPAFGAEDDLQRINGVGPMLRDLLNDIGVFYYWQVAEWTPENIRYVDGLLQHFKGRIDRDDWVGQAQRLKEESGAARRPGQYR